MQLPTSSIWGTMRRENVPNSSWHTTGFPQTGAVITGLQEAPTAYSVLIHSTITNSGSARKGNRGKRLLALARKTFHPSYTLGPGRHKTLPSRKGLSAKARRSVHRRRDPLPLAPSATHSGRPDSVVNNCSGRRGSGGPAAGDGRGAR